MVAGKVPKGAMTIKGTSAYYVFYPFVANFGGIERLIVDLALYLRRQGKTLVLLTFRNQVDFSQYADGDFLVEQIVSRRSLYAEAAALRKFVRDREIPSRRILVMEMRGAIYAGMALLPGYAVHIADPPSLLPRDLTKYSFSLASHYPALTANSSLLRKCRGQLVHWLTKRGVRRADSVVTMTQRNVEELYDAYGIRFAKVPPGVRIPDTTNRRRQSTGEVRFLSVCRLESSKRVDSIIHCLALLSAETNPHRRLMLKIVGEGSQAEELRALAQELGVGSIVEFTGLVSDQDLEKAYAESDVFVMPAIQGYGLPGLESLARGLQLVVHRDSGVTEFLLGIPQVQIIDSFDVSLTQAMRLAAELVGEQPKPVPPIPTSEQWAEAITELAGW